MSWPPCILPIEELASPVRPSRSGDPELLTGEDAIR